ncbi:helix-turn-helix transcriptional regulator [Paraburkholderia hospita]|uniref:helix-turn-helix transcriptional regulator n=1 Tax=Paraburkholderia hospita TaxID=169430 RepID=UPI001319FBC5|nr:WYL domain-containing protein [Paraburkholderia hospita]
MNRDEKPQLHKFDTFDYQIVDALSRDDYISTPELCAKLQSNPTATFVKNVSRRLNHLLDALRWVEWERRGKTDFWRRAEGMDEITGKSGPSHALALKMMERFCNQKLPPLLGNLLTPHFNAADETLKRHPHISPRYKAWDEKIKVVSAGFSVSFPDVDSVVCDAIAEALFQDECIDIIHRGRTGKDEADGMPQREAVLPLGLVESDGCIYLVAMSNKRSSEPEIFRMDRVSLCKDEGELARVPERLNAPKDFSLENFIVKQRAFDLSPAGDIVIELLFREDSFRHLQNRKISVDQITEVRDGGSIYVKATVTNCRKLRWWLREFGYKVEVLAPPDLRERIRSDAMKVAQMYSNPAPQSVEGSGLEACVEESCFNEQD